MSEFRRIRLAPSAALKEKRLSSLLAGRDASDPELVQTLRAAQVLGSLELSGVPSSWDEVLEAARGRRASGPAAALFRALHSVDPGAPFTRAAIVAWHGHALDAPSRFRTGEASREDAPPPAPPEFIEGRLGILEEWMNVDSGRELRPAQQGALALARLVEIRPFEDGNGRVSRLAASHLMVRAGARPPILVAGDGPRLAEALKAAFVLFTEPLAALLEEASERSLDVLIQALEAPRRN